MWGTISSYNLFKGQPFTSTVCSNVDKHARDCTVQYQYSSVQYQYSTSKYSTDESEISILVGYRADVGTTVQVDSELLLPTGLQNPHISVQDNTEYHHIQQIL